jgi:predicted O-methyltransferase YrrM
MNDKAKVLLKAIERAPPGVAVEIGCIRTMNDMGDGHSTVHLARHCQKSPNTLLSFDICQKNVETANKKLRKEGLEFNVYWRDGADALRQWKGLAFLFLDGASNPDETFAQYHDADLRPGGIMVIDDAAKTSINQFGKATIVKEFLDKHEVPYEIVPISGGAMLVATFPKGKAAGRMI